jgi:transposase
MANRRNSKAEADEVKAAELRSEAVELKKAGHTYREIAQALGVSLASAHGYVKQAVADLAEHTLEETEDMRRLENERLEAIQVKLWPERGDPKVASVLVQLSRRRAAINGLDRPQKLEVGGDLGLRVDVSKLSPEQQAQLDRLLADAGIE